MAGTNPGIRGVTFAWSPPSPQRLQLSRQRVGPLRDVAGAETDHIVAAAGNSPHHTRELGGILQRDHLAVAMGAQAEHEMIAVDARDRRLSGRIDFGDYHRV